MHGKSLKLPRVSAASTYPNVDALAELEREALDGFVKNGSATVAVAHGSIEGYGIEVRLVPSRQYPSQGWRVDWYLDGNLEGLKVSDDKIRIAKYRLREMLEQAYVKRTGRNVSDPVPL